MMLETLLNFETVFIENRPIMELIDSDFTYRSHLLEEWYEGRAATYSINVNLRDINFTRKPLSDRRYGGVITTGAVMVMTSGPFRSLPITRGAWVSSVIFNDPPEPPPDPTPEELRIVRAKRARLGASDHPFDERRAVMRLRLANKLKARDAYLAAYAASTAVVSATCQLRSHSSAARSASSRASSSWCCRLSSHLDRFPLANGTRRARRR